MKYFFVIILAVFIAGCKSGTQIEFTGTATGIDSGTFMIKDLSDTVVCKTDIKSGSFSLSHDWKNPGYYVIAMNNKSIGTPAFDAYLEAGKYTLLTNREKVYKYPDIQSTSKKQNELTAFYHLLDTVSAQLRKNVTDLTAQVNDQKNKALPPAAYAALAAKLKAAQVEEPRSVVNTLMVFADKYPDSDVSLHIMLNMNYQDEPVAYNKVFQKLSPAVQQSSSGALLKYWLDHYLPKTAGK